MRTRLGLAVLAAALAVPALARAGVGGPAFYVDGTVYRTVGTPTDLYGPGALARSFDTIYDFGGLQMNVATAAPGDTDYNGGRWQVHALSIPDYAAALAAGDANDNGMLDSDAEVAAAIAAGAATDTGIVKWFVCPVIKLPRS